MFDTVTFVFEQESTKKNQPLCPFIDGKENLWTPLVYLLSDSTVAPTLDDRIVHSETRHVPGICTIAAWKSSRTRTANQFYTRTNRPTQRDVGVP